MDIKNICCFFVAKIQNMYLQRNKSKYKNGKEYISTLICHKYRKDGKIKTKVLANLSHLPEALITSIENIRTNPPFVNLIEYAK